MPKKLKRILGFSLLFAPVMAMLAFFFNYDFMATLTALALCIAFVIWAIAVVYLIDSPRFNG